MSCTFYLNILPAIESVHVMHISTVLDVWWLKEQKNHFSVPLPSVIFSRGEILEFMHVNLISRKNWSSDLFVTKTARCRVVLAKY